MMLLLRGMPPAFEPGLSEMMEGAGMVAAWMVKPPGTFSTSAPVVVITSTGPSDAPAEMIRLAVRLVALLTVTGPETPSAAPPTLMPGPKLAVVVPLTQLVYWPVMVTVTEAPGVPMLGL